MQPVSRILPFLAMALGIGLSLPASAQMNPVTVQQCFVTVPKHMSSRASGTQIVYTINGHQPATKVVFAVSYRNSNQSYLRRVADVGSFSPGAPIDHHFDLYNDVTFGGKTAKCTAISVTWANGHVWHM
ncbi:MAG TPA: hypothetical protein VK702_05395 [Candidatus Acidoferrum sp.]|jgi:hypothetical protein|nr:hypothetical protein [Candidatus Acidoferrum sp.]